MPEQKENLVTFHLIGASISEVVGADGYSAKVTLDAKVKDLDTWEGILQEFDGLVVDRADFKSEIINILRKKNDELEVKANQIGLSVSEAIQRANQEVSLAKSELVKAQQQIRILEAKLQGQINELEELRRFANTVGAFARNN